MNPVIPIVIGFVTLFVIRAVWPWAERRAFTKSRDAWLKRRDHNPFTACGPQQRGSEGAVPPSISRATKTPETALRSSVRELDGFANPLRGRESLGITQSSDGETSNTFNDRN